MPKRRLHLSILYGFCVVCWFLSPGPAFATGLWGEYLIGKPLVAGEIQLVPVTLRHGMESRKSPGWPLKNPEWVYDTVSFKRNEKKADEAGIHLGGELDNYSVAGYKNHKFYFLFYTFATAGGCANEYVIQRTRINKLYYDFSGNPYKSQRQYLVEALALNNLKETKRAYEHAREYPLGKFGKRKIVIDFEIGCGEIPEVLEGKGWPYAKNPLYRRVQNYSKEPGLYDRVDYYFSSQYRITMEFNQQDQYSLELPF